MKKAISIFLVLQFLVLVGFGQWNSQNSGTSQDFWAISMSNNQIGYAGIGRGTKTPESDFIEFVYKGFRIMERGVANEVLAFVDFANERYAADDFNRVDFKELQRIAGTCVTGCDIVDSGPIDDLPEYKGFVPRLVKCAKKAYER